MRVPDRHGGVVDGRANTPAGAGGRECGHGEAALEGRLRTGIARWVGCDLCVNGPTICAVRPLQSVHYKRSILCTGRWCGRRWVTVAYSERVVDQELRARLSSSRVVVIEGPKACGKTETARQVASSEVLLDVDTAARQALQVDPSLVLSGAPPRLIDEWQLEATTVWNHARRIADERRRPGQFILTGSAVPADDDPSRHTGAGRVSTLRMRPMSLYESGHTNGAVSLGAVMEGVPPQSADPGLTVTDLAERITTGGWPAHQGLDVAAAARASRDYLQQILRVDVGRLTGERRDPMKLAALVASLARNVSTEVAITVLATDAGGSDGALSRHTIYDYLSVLERLMVVEDQPAWAPHMRSKAILRSAAKRHFVDPSLAAAALAATPARLLKDLNLLGLMFESLVIRDLRVMAQPLDGTVSHYRDNNGLEVDAVVQLADGRWAAFEVKLGPGMVDHGAASLLKFAQQIDTKKSGTPSMLAVITGTGYGYTRADGVAVIPVGALAP